MALLTKFGVLNLVICEFQGETTEDDGSVNNILDALGDEQEQRSSSAVEIIDPSIITKTGSSVMVVGMGDGESSGVGSTTSPTGSPHHDNEPQHEDYEHVYCQLDPYFVSTF